MRLLMRRWKRAACLTRALESLPSDMELQERGRAGRGLTRPELALLLSYAKIALQHDILESRVPDDPQLEAWLTRLFPAAPARALRAGIDGHSLRREIIALGLTNTVVNRGGPAMAVRLAGETRRPAPDVALAFMAAREVFDLPALWQRIDSLDGRVQGEAQLRLYEATRDLVNTDPLVPARRCCARQTLPAPSPGTGPDWPRWRPRWRASCRRAVRRAWSRGAPSRRRRCPRRPCCRYRPPRGAGPGTGHHRNSAGAGCRPCRRPACSSRSASTAHRRPARQGRGHRHPRHYDRLAIAQALGQLAAAHAAFTRRDPPVASRPGVPPWASASTASSRARGCGGGRGLLTVSRLLVPPANSANWPLGPLLEHEPGWTAHRVAAARSRQRKPALS